MVVSVRGHEQCALILHMMTHPFIDPYFNFPVAQDTHTFISDNSDASIDVSDGGQG